MVTLKHNIIKKQIITQIMQIQEFQQAVDAIVINTIGNNNCSLDWTEVKKKKIVSYKFSSLGRGLSLKRSLLVLTAREGIGLKGGRMG